MFSPPSESSSLLVWIATALAETQAAEEQAVIAFLVHLLSISDCTTTYTRSQDKIYSYPLPPRLLPTVESRMVPILTRPRSVSVLRGHNLLNSIWILIAYSRTPHFNKSKLNVRSSDNYFDWKHVYNSQHTPVPQLPSPLTGCSTRKRSSAPQTRHRVTSARLRRAW